MAILRLSNGSDMSVKLTVDEAMAAIQVSAATGDFVEVPGDDGVIHVRPTHVIAVSPSDEERGQRAGFRLPGRS